MSNYRLLHAAWSFEGTITHQMTIKLALKTDTQGTGWLVKTHLWLAPAHVACSGQWRIMRKPCRTTVRRSGSRMRKDLGTN